MKYLIILLISFNIFKADCQTSKKKNPGLTIDPDEALAYKVKNENLGMMPGSIQKFIPAGYSVLDTTYGDLNRDKLPDLVIVLKRKNETNKKFDIDHPSKRPILLLIQNRDGTYTLKCRNDDAILCYNCRGLIDGDDPFTEIVIKNGYFSIEHGVSAGAHWEKVTTFKYDQKKDNWYLYKDGRITYQLGDDDNLKPQMKKYLTVKDFGIVPFDKFNIYKFE